MKKLLAAVAWLALIAVGPAQAGSSLAIGASAGSNTGGAISAVTTHGLSAGAAGAVGVSAGTSAGIGVATPVGGISAGISQTNNFGAARSGVVGALGGGGAAAAAGNGHGFNIGAGFTNSTP